MKSRVWCGDIHVFLLAIKNKRRDDGGVVYIFACKYMYMYMPIDWECRGSIYFGSVRCHCLLYLPFSFLIKTPCVSNTFLQTPPHSYPINQISPTKSPPLYSFYII